MAPANQQLGGPKQAGGDFAFADRFSVVALARDPGPLGEALRWLPPWLLQEADSWAEFIVRHQERQEDYYPYPFPDPWPHLLAAPIAPTIKGVCRAAQSHLVGLSHLSAMAQGRASGSKDWLSVAREAQARGDTKAFFHAIGHVSDAVVGLECLQADVRSEGDPELTAQMEACLKKRRAQLVRKGLRLETENPSPSHAANEFKVEFYLVQNWITFPDCGIPGLMFWRNEAITRWLIARFKGAANVNYANDGLDFIKKTRQRLGLIPASEKNPRIWDVKVEPGKDGKWTITLLQRDGKRILHGFVQRGP